MNIYHAVHHSTSTSRGAEPPWQVQASEIHVPGKHSFPVHDRRSSTQLFSKPLDLIADRARAELELHHGQSPEAEKKLDHIADRARTELELLSRMHQVNLSR